MEFIEVRGDQDGRFERNEVVSINLVVSNEEGYVDAHNVLINLVNDDPYVVIDTDEINIGDLDAGVSYELWDDEYPTFHIRGDSPIHYSTSTFTITSDEGYLASFDIDMTIRHPMYLLVDDDNGDDYEEFYQEDLIQRPIVHDTWDVAANEALSQEYLNGYNFVVWQTGDNETPLTQEEQTLISNYLDQDGYLLLSGQFIGDDIGETEFHQNYLKARHVSDNTDARRLLGIDENQLTDGYDLLLVGGGGAGNGTTSPSSMEPLDGAEALFTYTNNEEIGGIYYEGDYHLVYLGFAMESVSGGGGTTTRLEILERVLDHFYDLGVDEDFHSIQPIFYEMGTPKPNPFNSTTSIQINVPYSAKYVLEVSDISGRHITELHNGSAMPGLHTYQWNAEGIPAGVYLFNLVWAEGSMVRKVVLVK